MNKSEQLKIVYVPIQDLKPNEYNPKKMSKAEAEQLTKSITEFGIVDPIVVNSASGREGIIIGGHQRYKVFQNLGYKEVPVVYVDIPDLKKEQELCVRLTKNTGSWDYSLLANFDEEMLLDTGFVSEELDKVFQLDDDTDTDDFDADAEAEKIKNCKVRRGDIYQLGDHRLGCLDATCKEDVEKLMDGNKADMVFTDPPYGVSYADKNKALNAVDNGNRIQTPIEGDHKSVEEMHQLWTLAFKNMNAVNKEGFSYYICSPQGGELMMMMMSLQEARLQVKHMIIWVKNNIVIGRSDYHYKHEPILYGWGKGTHKFYGGRQKSSVWEYDKPYASKLHPTMKPIALIAEAIKNSSKRSDIILDLFGGSGSTLIACGQTNRKCYMAEIDPLYCQVIITRWETLTGKKAIKLE